MWASSSLMHNDRNDRDLFEIWDSHAGPSHYTCTVFNEQDQKRTSIYPQRRAHLDEFLWRLVKFSTLVVRADDEHPHVVLARGQDGGPVQVIDEIPMQVDVIEFARVDGIKDDIRIGVG